MGTTAQKIEYLGTTKSQLKDQINYGLPTEKQITSSTTFREYVGSIFEAFLEALRNPDTLFTNLPKTSASGSQITLNGTANAPMRINLNPTAISQTTYTGKNLLNCQNIQATNDSTITTTTTGFTFTKTATGTNDRFVGTYSTTLEPNTTYTMYAYTNDFKTQLYFYTDSLFGNALSKTQKKLDNTETAYGFTTDNVGYVLIGFYALNLAQNTTKTISNIVLYKGDKTLTELKAYEPYVGGTASPNPSYPQDIHTISGNNSVVVEGKNKFTTDYKTTDTLTTYTKIDNNSFSYTCSGTWKGATFVVPCEENTDYFINYKEYNPNNRGTYCEVKGGQTNTSLMARYHDYLITFNSGENTSLKVTITNGTASDNTSGTISNIQLEKGTSATTFEEYQEPQTNPINLGEYELGTIGNYSNEFVRVATSDNLFDKNNIIENKRLNGSGVAQSDNGYYVSSFIKVEPNTKYIKNSPNVDAYHRFSYYSSNTESSFISNADSNTATTPSNCQYLRFCGLLTEINTTQLNKGETLLPYVPYEKGWYYKQGIGKATNNTISNGSSYSNIVYFSFPKPVDSLNYIWASRNTQVIYSNAQHSTSGNWNSADNIGKIVGGASEHTFWVGFPVGTTLAQAQEQLANGILYYIKATPTYTKITGELAQELEQVYKGMLSYDGTTNISQVNNDLAFELVGSAITK